MTGVAWEPISCAPVLLAPGRAARPHDTREETAPRPCPFCEGAEGETPLESYGERPGGGAPNTPGWSVRVVPNKFPVIPAEEGVHEIVVPTSRHVLTLAALSEDEVSRAVRVWAERLEVIAADERGLWPFCFMNEGAAAGASLQHSHAQIVGLPFTPPRLAAIERTFEASDPVAEDLAVADRRIVAEADGLVCWCPATPPYTGTVRIAPRDAERRLGESARFGAIGARLRDLAARVERALDAPALNLLVNQARPGHDGGFHWHIDLVPRLGTLAGLELGTGVMAIAGAAEDLAGRLREV